MSLYIKKRKKERKKENYQMYIFNPLLTQGFMVTLYYVKLAKMELHFSESPSLYDSRLGLVKREICVRFGRQK